MEKCNAYTSILILVLISKIRSMFFAKNSIFQSKIINKALKYNYIDILRNFHGYDCYFQAFTQKKCRLIVCKY